MKGFWTCVAVGGFVLSLAGTASATCAGHQQTVEADGPMTVASAPATTPDSKGGKK